VESVHGESMNANHEVRNSYCKRLPPYVAATLSIAPKVSKALLNAGYASQTFHP
jgi:hypothetical protein